MDLGFEIQKTNVGIKISILEYHMCQFWGKTDNFDFFGGWNELDGVDCSWVEVGARGSNTRLFNSARLFHEAIQENYWKS